MKPKNWRFYVYSIGDIENPVYVGKGSKNRLRVQERRFKREGQEIARFYDESLAYKFEREKIADLVPELNILPGGNALRPKCTRIYGMALYELL